MKHWRARRVLLAPALRNRARWGLAALALLFAAGCAQLESPEGWAAPVSSGDVVFAQVEDGTLAALRVEPEGASVSELWRYPGGGDGQPDFEAIYATPIIDAGTLYVASYAGEIVALDAANGQPLQEWGDPAALESNVVATPAYDGERLYVATEDRQIVVLDATTGDREASWTAVEGEGRIWGNPALGGGRLYVGNLDDRETRAFDTGTGEQIWHQADAGASAADLVLTDGLLIVGSFGSGLHALDVNDGTERWQFEGEGWFLARPMVADRAIYAATLRGFVYALNEQGEEQWRFAREGEKFRAAPVVAGGVLVVASHDGLVVGLDPADGALLWEQQLSDAHIDANPLVRDADVLYLTNEGDLVAIAPGDGALQRINVPDDDE